VASETKTPLPASRFPPPATTKEKRSVFRRSVSLRLGSA
jgi:hypothetical protein